MNIYQLKTPEEFIESMIHPEDLEREDLMKYYAEDVAKRFAAECVNEALGNKMEVSNELHREIETRYNSINWNKL